MTLLNVPITIRCAPAVARYVSAAAVRYVLAVARHARRVARVAVH
jgi:hypothetical protein